MNTALVKAATDTIAMVCGQELVEQPSYTHRREVIDNSVAVVLEFVGEVTGKVVIRFTEDNAKKTASAMMCGMPVEELDAMAISALSELGNMIMGGAASNIAEQGVNVDITTPTLELGAVHIKGNAYSVSIPLQNSDIRVVLDISITRGT